MAEIDLSSTNAKAEQVMSLWKRGKQYWLDVVVHGERHREPLGTTDWRQASDLEKKRIAELQKRPPDPTKRARTLSTLSVSAAITVYADERRSQVSARMVAWWKEMGRPLAAFFEDKPIRKISPADLMAYQNVRRDLGRAPKTVNSELSVLRQILKHAKLWYRFADDYKPLKNTKPPAGQALTDQDQAHLFEIAKSKPAWFYAYVAATLKLLLWLTRVRDQRAPVEARIVGPSPPLHPAIEDTRRMARPIPQRHMPGCASRTA
jgi:hypothetical protein